MHTKDVVSPYGADRLYSLLPAVYRRRDAEEGYPLKALVAVLAREAQVLERDLEQLYENAFIETCAEWVVPYLGDLVGVRPLPAGRLRRDEVANTLSLRRRKGTAGVLEQLAADVTGWPARVVESLQNLATTQFLDHPRPAVQRTPDLRRAANLERLGGPFDGAARTIDVRRAASGQGRHNVGQVALWLWRLGAWPSHLVEPAPAVLSGSPLERRFTFHPLGIDAPLFHHPESESGPAQLAGELNVPEPIRRRQLAADLRRAEEGGQSVYVGGGRSLALYTRVAGQWQPLAERVVAADLGDWQRPIPADAIAVDPERGRFAFGSALDVPAILRVSCYHGFSAGLGGGQYLRRVEAAETAPFRIVGDADDPRLEGGLNEPLEAPLVDSLTEALVALEDLGDDWAGETRVIEIRDSRTYAEVLPAITLPAGSRLVIRAANRERPILRLGATFEVTATADSSLALDGLLISSSVLAPPLSVEGELNRLTVSHSTLVPGLALTPTGAPAAPGQPSLVVLTETAEVVLHHSITGPLWVAAEADVVLEDCLLDAGDRTLAAYAGPDGSGQGGALDASRVTVVGKVAARGVGHLENSLFLGPVTVERRQEGCVRYSWVAPGSRVPRRFRCQPTVPAGASPTETTRAIARVAPRFVTLRYGRPAYGQLDWRGPAQILRGGEDGAEMGAFSELGQYHRLDNLRQRLDEYLPVGLEAGVFLAS